jgi:prophage regulatory protein
LNDPIYNTTTADSVSGIMRMPEVIEFVGMSRASIYRLMKLGEFPQQAKIGFSAVGWSRAEVVQWFTERMNARPTAAEGELQQAA